MHFTGGLRCFDDSLLWESINDHESRISELEKICKEMNTNISSLQKLVNALQNNDYITNVSPVKDGGDVIGYVIDFSSGESITIYHGKDGKDGQDGAPGKDGQNGENGADGKDGQDGATPIIGVKQDVDGVYYWTLNGDWLLDDNGNKVKAEGKDGQDGSNGSSGSNGKDGQDGSDGKDGVTPQLKVEDGYWYVSYDNGANWTQIGKATGDKGDQGETGPQGPQGPQGAPGVGGDSMFADVDYSSSADYVIFILGNGTQIQVPTWSAFQALQAQCDQMNSNIEALQVIVNALQNNDYVTGVSPIYEGGKEIGYVITFSKSGSVTIYHGQDGKDGQNGAPGKDGEDGEDGKDGVDGATPIIGVKKDVDGIYYWTLNGDWLLDNNGNKVKAEGKDGQNGSNGSSGSNGQNGSNGKDGVTPQLKIENGYWYVSYDDGYTWEQLGKATGENGNTGATGPQGPQGPQGNPGTNGDSFFSSVTQDDNYVYLVLANGETIVIPKSEPNPATLTLGDVSGSSATFNGTVSKTSLDLKVTVYYSTSNNLTVYKYTGKASQTEFDGNSFVLTLSGLRSETKYYYFVETVYNGKTYYSEVSSFNTGAGSDLDMNPEEGNM